MAGLPTDDTVYVEVSLILQLQYSEWITMIESAKKPSSYRPMVQEHRLAIPLKLKPSQTLSNPKLNDQCSLVLSRRTSGMERQSVAFPAS